MTNYSFSAEIPKLMNMIIHNFYSSKDIFIRELISNASDAIDKLKYESLSKPQYLEASTEFSIKVQANKENNTFVIEDSGIGMTENDLVNCLGTIAKSGTEEFVKNMLSSDSNKSTLIGQFGVGFYSAYLISDTVSVITRKAGEDKIFEWVSDGMGSFSITEKELSECDIIRGTRIYLNIRSDCSEYLENTNITRIIKKHSSYITYPVLLHTIKTKEIPDEESLETKVDESLEKDETVEETLEKDETVSSTVDSPPQEVKTTAAKIDAMMFFILYKLY